MGHGRSDESKLSALMTLLARQDRFPFGLRGRAIGAFVTIGTPGKIRVGLRGVPASGIGR